MIDAQTGLATPLVSLVIGSTRYREMKETAAQLGIDRLPDTPATHRTTP
ncbi:hypothetical protein [Nocardioides stalactiti]|nr:hypothetical protein [Nocardioides stalactiti]